MRAPNPEKTPRIPIHPPTRTLPCPGELRFPGRPRFGRSPCSAGVNPDSGRHCRKCGGTGKVKKRIPPPAAEYTHIRLDPSDPKAAERLVKYLALCTGDLCERMLKTGGHILFNLADGHEPGKDPSLSRKSKTILHIDIRRP